MQEVIDHLYTENDLLVDKVIEGNKREQEFKRLLQAAVDDFHWLAEWRDKCALCGSRNVEGDCAVVGGSDCDEVYTWRHEAEALELIGGAEDVD